MKKRLTKKRSKVLPVLFIFICLLLAAAVAGVFYIQKLFAPEFELSDRLTRLDAPFPLYTLDIDDYYFDEFINEHGGASTDAEVSEFLTEKLTHGFYKYMSGGPDRTGEASDSGLVSGGLCICTDHTACSVISARDKENAHVWGRNYDWSEPVTVIVRSRPENGYASISTCDFTHVASSSDILESEDIADKFTRLAAYYVPLDGVNEAGLCVADLEVNEGGMTETFTDKPDLTVTTAIRLLLNKAATVEEAVSLLDGFDIHPSGSISHHIAVSDASGNSVVLEFVEGRTEVVERHYVTNFTLFYDNSLAGGEGAQLRYRVLKMNYQDYEGVLSKDKIKSVMKDASQTEGDYKTCWSIVYCAQDKKLDYYFRCDYEHPYTFGFDF